MRKLSKVCFMVLLCGALTVTWGQTTQQKGKSKASSFGEEKVAPGKNKAAAQQVMDDLFSRGRYELIDQLFAKDCVIHTNNKALRCEEGIEEGKGFRSAAPDLVMTGDQVVEQGNMVTVRWTARGTNTGKGNGIPATGKKVLVHGTSRFRFVNGKIAEVWTNYDHHGMLRQLGVEGKPPAK
jgi:steroid delta-isomerase-like uncharacterized protein